MSMSEQRRRALLSKTGLGRAAQAGRVDDDPPAASAMLDSRAAAG
jgi:hypothetical protein